MTDELAKPALADIEALEKRVEQLASMLRVKPETLLTLVHKGYELGAKHQRERASRPLIPKWPGMH